VVFGVAGRLGQLFDHQFLRRIGGIAHPQIDHIVACAAFFILQTIKLGKQIGGEPANTFGDFDGKRPALGNRFDGFFGFRTH